MARILIENGWVIPIVGGRPYIERGAVAIRDDRIAAVGPAAEVRATFTPDQTVDASGKAVLPGFVNTHTHLMGAFNKALTEDPPCVSGGLFTIAMPLQRKYIRPEEVYFPAMVHAMEMVRTGTTCINEVWWFEQETAKAVRDLGLRAVIAENISEADLTRLGPDNLHRDFDEDEGKRSIDEALAFIEGWHEAAGGRITCRFGPFSPDTCSEKTLLRVKELAGKKGLGYHVHLAQIPGEVEYMRKAYGKGSVEFMGDLGYLSPNFVGIHCVFMTPDEIAMMAESGAHMSHTAYLVGKRAYFPPMTEVYKQGVSVSIGSDWLSNDVFKILRAAILLTRQQAGDVSILDGPRVLELATLGGARALGLEKEVGSLEAGKKADLFLLDLQTPWVNPIRPENLLTNIVYNANGGDVTDVLIDGSWVVRDRKFVTVDERDVLTQCQKRADVVWERARDLFQS
ncbi:MAG: amidohydrolase family protein [Nitrospinota bacterium]